MATVTTNDEIIAQPQGLMASFSENIGDQDTHACEAREEFKEKNEVLGLIANLLSSSNSQKSFGLATRISAILNSYQEDSLILDPHITDLAKPLCTFLASNLEETLLPKTRLVCSLIYLLTKICGYKAISRSEVFPHEWKYLGPVLNACKHKSATKIAWEIEYVLILWLTLLLLLPFNFNVIVNDNQILKEIAHVADDALLNPSLAKQGALIYARIFARDLKLLDSFVVEFSASGHSKGQKILGFLNTLNETLKILPSKITDLELIQKISEVLSDEALYQEKTTVGFTSKLKTLRVRVAARLGSASDPAFDRILFDSLKEKEYAIRWAAAKGLGRVGCSIENLLQDVSTSQDVNLFQGRSLAVAELIVRKKFSSTDQILRSMELASNGLEHPVSSNAWQIRDGACYIIWAVSRYTELTMEVVNAILPALLTVCLLDREIACRRVGAAALQELIGRIGTVKFVPGMKLLELVDFWTVSDIKSCCLETSIEVMHLLPHLRSHFVSHLRDLKLVHSFDSQLRNLASQTMVKMITEKPARYAVIESVIEQLVLAADVPVTSRQGGLLFLTDAVKNWSDWDDASQTLIRNVIPKMEKERLYRGKGGESIRTAACGLLESLSRVPDSVAFKPSTTERYNQTIFECLRHMTLTVQIAAAKAALAITTYRSPSCDLYDKMMACVKVVTENVASRRGVILGLASINPSYVENYSKTKELFDFFTAEIAALPKHPLGNADFVDAESRKFALFGLLRIAHHNPSFRKEAINACLLANEDYAIDRRGDVGSWIRELAINGLVSLMEDCVVARPPRASLLSILSRVGERLDRIRGVAANRLHDLANDRTVSFVAIETALFTNSQVVPDVPVNLSSSAVSDGLFAKITAEFKHPVRSGSTFSTSSCVFERSCNLIGSVDAETDRIILKSLSSIVGGLTAETVSDAVCKSLLVRPDLNKILSIYVDILVNDSLPRVFSRQEKNNRLTTPVFNTISLILKQQPQQPISDDDRFKLLHKIDQETLGSKDPHKLRAAVAVLSELVIGGGDGRQVVEQEVVRVLVHNLINTPMPSIRSQASTALYLKFVETEGLEETADFIASVDWAKEGVSCEDEVSELCKLLNLEIPTRTSTPALEQGGSRKARERLPDYAEFVMDEHRQ
jgi:Tubulin folding cofactor D C terminal